MGRYGFSFSWRLALGISRAQARLSRRIGIPLSQAGLERKVGRMAMGRGRAARMSVPLPRVIQP